MSAGQPNAFQRLFRGETSFDFAGRWRRWFAISGIIIAVGAVSLGVRGLNFSIEFKGGTQWTVPTTASVATTRNAIGSVNSSLRQANIQQLVNRQTGKKEIQVSAPAKATANDPEVTAVTRVLAKMAGVPTSAVNLNAIGPSWGSDITNNAVRAVIVFLIACAIYIWLRFEGKMAVAALTALLHDILVTAGIYSLSGFQVSPDTVIAFLTILGYSLYDTIVVFDKVQENTKGLASTGRMTYTETVNLSMNAVLARSLNTSLVAILPILSILVIGSYVLGASALNDFGLALLIGLATGAYSSIFIASPLLALMKEREPRYAQIRQRLAARPGGRRLTPAAAALGALPADYDEVVPARSSRTEVPPSGESPVTAGSGLAARQPEPGGDGSDEAGASAAEEGAGATSMRPRKRVLTGGRAATNGRPEAVAGEGGGASGSQPARGANGSTGAAPDGGSGANGRPVPPGASPRTPTRPPPRPRKKRRR